MKKNNTLFLILIILEIIVAIVLAGGGIMLYIYSSTMKSSSSDYRWESEMMILEQSETEIFTEPEMLVETEITVMTEWQAETELISEVQSELGSEAQVTEEGTIIELETETAVETDAIEKLVVAIDPGHQGYWIDMNEQEPNAPGSSDMKAKATTGTEGRYSGKPEFELNLEISLLLREELQERGYEVILTREDNDTAISNAERALMAYEHGGDIYVRIHANGADDSSVQGALAMIPSSSNPYVGYLADDSYKLAQCILDAYCSRAEFRSQGIQYYDNMTGINWSKLPVMILEMGFMSNESDDLRMSDPTVQTNMVAGIADGIDAYFREKGMFPQKTVENKVSVEDQKKMDDLTAKLETELLMPAINRGEEWAVSIKDLSTGAAGSIHGDEAMKSASIIKPFIMAAIYDRVCYPASEERYIYFYESYEGELKQLITDMITVSDNDAANRLIEGLGSGDAQAGMAVVNQFCEENGYTATKLGRKFLEASPTGDNYTSVNDCMCLLESIYTGNCVCEEASEKMFAYFKQQTRTAKIPAGVADTSAVVSNKTGELYGEYGDFVENDIAVVEDGDKAYILCVMSGKLQNNDDGQALIREISKMVWENRKK